MLLGSIAIFAQKLSPDQLVGLWQCDDFKIEIFKSGNTYSGKLLWQKICLKLTEKCLRRIIKPQRKTKKPIQAGIVHITALVYKNGEYMDGKLYSVQDGNTYSLKGFRKDVDNLETRDYKGVPIIGKTFT